MSAILAFVAIPSSIFGMGGKSLGSDPLIRASNLAHFNSKVFALGERLISTLSMGKELINSVRSPAGTVIAPSSSTLAPIQQLIAISRLVVTNFKRDWSVTSMTLLVIGKVVLVATALPTMLNPRFRLSWRHDSLILHPPKKLMQLSSIYYI